ncbi:hypothetical protein F4680DRAFT_448505 [Xylaria scruposa]|nr:hypothetical protein F4680DRAFT_448505 [Xylaria scruposa]
MASSGKSEDSSNSDASGKSLVDTLRDSIINHCCSSVLSECDNTFLPNDAVNSLVTTDTITAELDKSDLRILKESDRDRFIKWIQRDAPKLFLIHIHVGLEPSSIFRSLKRFKKRKFKDTDLPIEDPTTEECHFKECFKSPWSTWSLRSFCDNQWRFLSPKFESTRTDYTLHVRDIFPFIDKVIEEAQSGGFSNVYKVTIHEAHRDHDYSQVAIKEIRTNNDQVEGGRGRDTEEVWEVEAQALTMANALNHPHLVKCIAAIRKGNKRYFVFPWAGGGSLRDFWKNTPEQNPTRETIRDSIYQLQGLADGLYSLHNYKPKQSSSTENQSSSEVSVGQVPDILVGGQVVIDQDDSGQSIRHGDLKPENILRFLDCPMESANSTTSVGTLKIADMGLAKRHVVATQYRGVTSTMYGTALYEAPEVYRSMNGARSRLYDVWSMGCIIFEFILWILYGHDPVTALHDRIRKGGNQYFEALTRTDRTAQLNRTVSRWIRYLEKNEPECRDNSALGDLLKLVKTKLLVVDLPPGGHSWKNGQLSNASHFQPPPTGENKTNYRGTSEDLLRGLEDIISKLDNDHYAFSDQPRDEVHPPSTFLDEGDEAPPSSLEIPGIKVEQNLSASRLRSLTMNRNVTRTTKADYTLPPLEGWEYPVDNEFAETLISQLNTTDLRPLPPQDRLCQRCRNMDFWKGGFAIEDRVADLQERSLQCSFCEMLWNAHRAFGLPKAMRVRFERHQSTLKLSGTDCALPIFSIFRSLELQTPLPIQIGFPQLPQPGTSLFFSLLRLWLQDCDEKHEGCRTPNPATLPTRLIDVGTINLPQLYLCETSDMIPNGQRYIALSHPWGDRKIHPPFSTLRKDLAKFKKNIPYDQLPATFRDAVLATRALDIRFLWIDSLCIIQGEDGDFQYESKRMEDVFSCAYCVLAASRATGQHDGFLQPIKPREYITFQGRGKSPFYVCENIDDFSRDVLEGSLNTRGWVLQERALARRTIFFTENQAYFECGKGVRCQSLTKMHNNMADFLGDPNFPNKAISVQRSLKIRYFQDLYKQYSRLSFTHIEDRPFAIEGLESRLRSAYKTDGAYGIFDDGPGKGLFHRSLLWQRGEDNPSSWLSLIDFPVGRRITVPTWSWMAYQGGIDYVDPPFDQTVWEKDDIHPPQIKSNDLKAPNTHSIHSDSMELFATAREFNVTGHQEGEVKLVYDTHKSKLDGMRRQCVVVAKSKEGRKVQDKKYYVLLVSPLSSSVDNFDNIYERVGAGMMLGRFINFNEPGKQARIR